MIRRPRKRRLTPGWAVSVVLEKDQSFMAFRGVYVREVDTARALEHIVSINGREVTVVDHRVFYRQQEAERSAANLNRMNKKPDPVKVYENELRKTAEGESTRSGSINQRLRAYRDTIVKFSPLAHGIKDGDLLAEARAGVERARLALKKPTITGYVYQRIQGHLEGYEFILDTFGGKS